MKPITIYWSETSFSPFTDESYFYPDPTTMQSEMIANKAKIKTGDVTFIECPAVSNKFKKILVFKSPLTFSHYFNSDTDENKPLTSNYIPMTRIRERTLINGPIYNIKLGYIFFADEPLDVFFTPPYFHKPKYTKYGSIIPGEFNIGKWFRPFNTELQMWENSGEIHFEENEPLFYAELKTDRPIQLKRFAITPKLLNYLDANINLTMMYGRGQSLESRYNRFKNVGMRSKVLKEIHENLLD